jgi:hypothetical protein
MILVPFLAISTKFFGNMFSTYYRRFMIYDAPARFFVSWQCVLFESVKGRVVCRLLTSVAHGAF